MRLFAHITTAALAGGAVIALAGSAFAHAHLVSSTPAANSTGAAPKTISLTFSEKLTPAFSKFELGMADGMKVNVKTSLAKDGKTLVGAPQGAMMPGAYTVTWHAASADDGHKMDGTFNFTVK